MLIYGARHALCGACYALLKVPSVSLVQRYALCGRYLVYQIIIDQFTKRVDGVYCVIVR